MGDAGPARPTGWWKSTVVYQIWPASYKDSNGDGWGDIPGIISTIPYLQSLGIETIWLSPMYASPMVDFGYDISDYEAVNPLFGTMEDMQTLIDGLHARGMKIILDLVINHTSDQHAWFQESRRSKNNPKSDWYMWRPAKWVNGKRKEPNNWRSWFGGSAWKWCEAREEYYLHLFAKEQPDLNWENEVARKAIYDTSIRFWLRRGVDGFRIDTCNNAEITDPDQEFQPPQKQTSDGPRAHEFLKEMRKVFDEFGEIMTVGELGLADSREKLLKYVDASRRELREVFDFGLFSVGREGVDYDKAHGWKLSEYKRKIKRSQTLINGTHAWTTTFMENHDAPRSISRFCTRDEKYRVRAGKLMATFLGTTSGTLFLYQGQEIGMVNIPRDWGPEEYKDIDAINFLKGIRERYPGDVERWQRAMDGLNLLGRDNARTPVQWDGTKHAGFTTGTPWMRVNDNYPDVNIKQQQGDDTSVLSYWKEMLRIRWAHEDLFIFGEFVLLNERNAKTFTYEKRSGDGRRALVELNFSDEEQSAIVDLVGGTVISNVDAVSTSLAPWEARITLLET